MSQNDVSDPPEWICPKSTTRLAELASQPELYEFEGWDYPATGTYRPMSCAHVFRQANNGNAIDWILDQGQYRCRLIVPTQLEIDGASVRGWQFPTDLVQFVSLHDSHDAEVEYYANKTDRWRSMTGQEFEDRTFKLHRMLNGLNRYRYRYTPTLDYAV